MLLLAISMSAASCVSTGEAGLPDDALVLVVSSDLAVGPERVLVSALGSDNRSLVFDEPVRLAFFAPDGTSREEVPARFVWTIPNLRGMWTGSFTFDTAGVWTPAVRTTDDRLVYGVPFAVTTESVAVNVGEPAPASQSKTLADGPIETITSDPDPDRRLYESSVAEAVTSGRPSVIVFATPAFCVSQTCGPSLDIVKTLVDRYPGVNWVHVEVYDNLDASSAEELVPVQAAAEWRLPSEPWVFVVNVAGIVTDRFDGVVDSTEIEVALNRLDP